MPLKRELINLTITNNTNSTLVVPVFKGGVSGINSTTKYTYDITAGSIVCGYGDIVINSVLYNFTFDGTLDGLVNAMTNLGFSYFSWEISGGNTYVYTVDNVNIYGTLNICTVTTTTTTTTSMPAMFNVSGTSGVLACSFFAGWNGNVTFSGGTGTFCNSTDCFIIDNLAAFDLEVPNGATFYLSDGLNVRQYTRNGGNYSGTAVGACVAC